MTALNNKREFLISLSIKTIPKNINLYTLMMISENLTDEIYEFLKESRINLELEDLNLFCLTNKNVHYYNKYIGRYDNNDYDNAIKTLKSTTERIQYYSIDQVKIILPPFPLPSNTLIRLFINKMEEKNYDNKVIDKFLKFFNKVKKPRLVNNFISIKRTYFVNEVYSVSLEKSYINKIKHMNLIENIDNLNDTKKQIIIDNFIKKIEKNYEKEKNLFLNISFKAQGCTSYIKAYLPKYNMESIQYWELNTNINLLNAVKKILSYEIAEHINYYKHELDLFSIFIFAFTVENFKFLMNSDLDAINGIKSIDTVKDNTKYKNKKFKDGWKFRSQIKKLKKDSDTVQCFNNTQLNIMLPFHENANISLMIYHLQERAVHDKAIASLIEIFHHRSKNPIDDEFIENKKIIINDKMMPYLKKLYDKDRSYMDTLSKENKFLKLLEDFDGNYAPNPNADNKHYKIKEYTSDVKILLEKY